MFTRKEGTDDGRDVVAQRAVGLPYMTQTRDVLGGKLTTKKTSNGVGGSWTSIELEPDLPKELPETRYIFSTVISADQINNPKRIQWLANKEGFDVGSLMLRRMEIVRLLPFGSAKRPGQRTLAFGEIEDEQANHYNLVFGVTKSIKAAIGEVAYNRVGVAETLLAQYINIVRCSTFSAYTLSIVFQPSTTGYREPYAIDGSATSVALGYERGAYSYFGVPYIHYKQQNTGQLIHSGLQQLRYIRARAASESSSQSQILQDALIFEAPRGVYYGDPLVTRVSKSKLFAVTVNISTQTILPTGSSPPEYVSNISVGSAKAFVSLDDGLSWSEIVAPAWDMSDFNAHSQFIDFRTPDFYFRANRPFQTQFLTRLLPWSDTAAIGASFFYNSANSSSGGEYKLFLMSEASISYLPVAIEAYKYVLVGACRPSKKAVFTFRARADPFLQTWQDGMYPEVAGQFQDFDPLVVTGYSDRTVIAVYDGTQIVIRPLPWTRLFANSEVFCLGAKEIGTVVFNTTPSVGDAAYWVFSSTDYGQTWKENFAVDGLSDAPKFSTEPQAQKEVIYDNGDLSSLPPQTVFPELIGGEKIAPCPGVNI